MVLLRYVLWLVKKKTLAALWLVKKKTLAALLTNQIQNWNKSWSFHVLPWFLVGCLLYLNFLDWMLWIPSLGFVTLEWKEFFFFFLTLWLSRVTSLSWFYKRTPFQGFVQIDFSQVHSFLSCIFVLWTQRKCSNCY